jgi:tetratricopeptide (TPR) repeat protein
MLKKRAMRVHSESMAKPNRTRVFISYSHDSAQHSNRVLQLANDLRGEGVDAWLDQYEEAPLKGWPQWMVDQIREAEFVLVVCTETYNRRFEGREESGPGKGAKWEGAIITTALYESEGKNAKFIPVVFETEDLGHRPHVLQNTTHYELNKTQRYEALYWRLTKQIQPPPSLGRVRGRATLGAATRPPLAAIESRQDFFGRVWTVPSSLENPFFTGRRDLLSGLQHALAENGRVALTGMSGSGKTQVAGQYAWEQREQYDAVLWVSGASRATLLSDFAKLALLLDLPQKEATDPEEAAKAVCGWLQLNRKWLLIFDNVEDVGVLEGFLPSGRMGHVIVTTQGPATGVIARAVPVEEMPPEDAELLLLRRAKVVGPSASLDAATSAERAAAREIARELGGLPLALDQAGAYIEETRCGLAGYLSAYGKEGRYLRKLRGKGGASHPESVAVSFTMGLRKLERKSRAAAEAVRLCALLHAEAIPEEIFVDGADELGRVLKAVGKDPLKLDAAIGAALSYSLLRRDAARKTLRIHRLVQDVVRDTLERKAARMWAERSVRAVARTFPSVEFTDWGSCERLLAHALACAPHIEQWGMEFPEAAWLLNQTGRYLHRRARFAEAEPLYKRALGIWEKALGPEHPDVATSLNNLALLYQAQGKLAEAEPLYKRSLDIVEKALGPEHPNVAASLNNLALLYQAQGKLGEAEPLFKRALGIREKALGPEHPDVAASLNNLAALYQAQGKLAEAEPLYKRALGIWEKALGPEHPDVAAILNNLALLYKAQGKLAEAEPLHKRSLGIREKALGPEHPDVASSLNNLALLYQAQGKLAEAEPLYKRSLAIWEKALGPEHPDVATSLNNLAALYREQGKYAEAELLYERSLGIREKALGPEHPAVATVLENYALLLRQTGREGEAGRLEARALAIRAKQARENPPG